MRQKYIVWIIIGILIFGVTPGQYSMAAATTDPPQESDLTVAVDTQDLDTEDPDLSEKYFVVQYEDGTIETRGMEEAAGIQSAGDPENTAVLEEQMELYEDMPSVEIVEPIQMRYIDDQTESYAYNDPYFSNGSLWGIEQVRADDLGDWEYASPLSNIIVAVIDTGMDMDHEDLVGTITDVTVGGQTIHGFNAITESYNPQDDHGHGTHVAGTIAATGDNNLGVVGVASGVKILPVKVMNSNGDGTTEDVAQGIRWAADHGADVINLSIGSTDYSEIEEAAVNYAYDKGVVIVAASGNDSNNWTSGAADLYDSGQAIANAPVNYPAAYDNALAVGAVGQYGGSVFLSDFSNSGPETDVVAPGEAINSTTSSGGYGLESGTSMASPHVAGVAALLKAQYPNATVTQIMDRIKAGAVPVTAAADSTYGGSYVDYADYYGAGIVSAYRSMALDNTLLTGIALDGVSMSSFSNLQTEYLFQYENASTPPAVTATPQSIDAVFSIVRTPSSGFDANQQSVVVIRVEAIDTTIEEYTLTFTNIPTTEVNGETTYDFSHMTSSQAISVDGTSVEAIQVDVNTVGGSVLSASLPDIEIETTAGALAIVVEIPAGTVVTGPAGWNGVLHLPELVATPTFDTGGTLSYALEIGSATEHLTFSKAVRILLPDQGGKRVGYGIGTSFTEITNTLSHDNQSTGDLLAAGGDGKITVGDDLAIWTKHFTTFATYTVSDGDDDGGGGGGGGDDPAETETTTPAVSTDSAITLELTDISNHWAKDAITALVSKGAITGYPDGTFQPDELITRAEFVSLLVKAQGRTGSKTTGFTDVSSHWAKEAIEIANYSGIILNQEGAEFRPDDPITREEMAVMMNRSLAYISQMEEVTFKDKDEISVWAAQAIQKLYQHEIMVGYPDGTFRPQGEATRAEAVTLLFKTMN